MSTPTELAMEWTGASSIGYPALFLGVLLGSVVPVVPTGAVVGVAAAVAMTTDHLWMPAVLVVATLAAFIGDAVTYTVARLGSDAALSWLTRHQHADRMGEARSRFTRRGWQLVVVGRLLPAGRIPVLVAAATLAYPWRRVLPASLIACALWAGAYALLGVLSGGIFDSPLLATLIAGVLVLAVSLALNLIGSRRDRGNTKAGTDIEGGNRS
jgi:membrane protein DedA with SNARE-associated domain